MDNDEFLIVLGAMVVAFLVGVVWGYKLARQANKHTAVVERKIDQSPRPKITPRELREHLERQREPADTPERKARLFH